jgi:uncharacterized protein (TIRG00374 family)
VTAAETPPTDESSTPPARRGGKLLRAGGSAALLSFIAWKTDWAQVAHAFARLDIIPWLLGVFLYAATQVLSSIRWQIIAGPLGFRRPLRHYISFYFIGMFFNLVLPTSVGGDVVRALYLDGRSGRRLDAFLSVFVDRLSGLLVLIAMACVAAALCPLDLPQWIPWSVWSIGLCAALGLAGLLMLAARRVRAGSRQPSLPRRPRKDRLDRFLAQLPTVLAMALRPVPLTLSLCVQVANVALVWLVGLALDAPVPAAYYWILVPLVTLMTLVPISLNGMGVREGGTVLLLAPLGVPAATALSLSFLWFAAFTAASLFGVVLYLFGRFPRFEVRGDDEVVGNHPDQGRSGQPAAAA